MVRVVLPYHLRVLAQVAQEAQVEVPPPVTVAGVLGALEERYPMLRGTIREHGSLNRRKFLRYFAAGEDISFEPTDKPLPETVASGKEPLMVVGSIAGG